MGATVYGTISAKSAECKDAITVTTRRITRASPVQGIGPKLTAKRVTKGKSLYKGKIKPEVTTKYGNRSRSSSLTSETKNAATLKIGRG